MKGPHAALPSLLMLAMTAAGLAGCDLDSHGPDPASSPTRFAPAAAPMAPSSPRNAAELFDELAAPRDFRILVAPQDWAWLQDNALAEEYVPAEVQFEGKVFPGAAVRYKGGYGSLYACFDDQGNRLCPKLSLKVRFNKDDPDGRFLGLRRLVFNSNNRDETALRERLAYATFRAAGLPAPRAVHARVQVNDEAPSLYTLVEDIDHEFLEDRFEDPDGNLLKEAWPGNPDVATWINALETNEDAPDVSRMTTFAEVLAGTADHPEGFPEAMAPWVDAEALVRYLAVDMAAADWDGIMKFYCSGPWCGNHNFHVYDDPTTGRFVVIPWDLDHTFEYPDRDLGRSWSDDGPEACAIVQIAPTIGIRAPQCDPLLGGIWRHYEGSFLDHLAELSAPGGPLSLEVRLGLLDRYRAMILPLLEDDPLGPELPDWRRATARLREALAAQDAEIRLRLAERVDRPGP